MHTRSRDQALVRSRVDIDKLPERVAASAYDVFRE